MDSQQEMVTDIESQNCTIRPYISTLTGDGATVDAAFSVVSCQFLLRKTRCILLFQRRGPVPDEKNPLPDENNHSSR